MLEHFASAFTICKNRCVLTFNCRPSPVDRGDSFFLPSMFEVDQGNSLRLFGFFITILLLHIHHHLPGHTCLQSPMNNSTENCDYDYVETREINCFLSLLVLY